MRASGLRHFKARDPEDTIMANLHAQLISPDRVIFDGEVKSVMIPGIEGDMTVLPGHQPLVTMLFPGVIFAVDAEGHGRRAFVRGGFVEITATTVTILAEDALTFDELSPERIEEEILRFQMTRDASSDGAVRAQADAAIGRLEELKGTLRL
jgi:F-type H+-transporting ATPase subunit epsilon